MDKGKTKYQSMMQIKTFLADKCNEMNAFTDTYLNTFDPPPSYSEEQISTLPSEFFENLKKTKFENLYKGIYLCIYIYI